MIAWMISAVLYAVSGLVIWDRMMLMDMINGKATDQDSLARCEASGRYGWKYHATKTVFLAGWPVWMVIGFIGARLTSRQR